MDNGNKEKLKVQMYLCPKRHYLSNTNVNEFIYYAKEESPKLFSLLEQNNVEIVPCLWDGTIEKIPTDQPVLVQLLFEVDNYSHFYPNFFTKLVDLGHLPFYEDEVYGRLRVSWDGRIEDFLRRLRECHEST